MDASMRTIDLTHTESLAKRIAEDCSGHVDQLGKSRVSIEVSTDGDRPVALALPSSESRSRSRVARDGNWH